MQPKPSRNRSRRLRKKLHIGEFAEYGFEVKFASVPGLSRENQDKVLDDFLEQAIEAHQLSVGGGSSLQSNGEADYQFFTVSYERPIDAIDRELVQTWLENDTRVESSSIKVGELVDSWYSELDEATE